MSWNYRVVHISSPDSTSEFYPKQYAICAVQYDDYGNIQEVLEDAPVIVGGDMQDLSVGLQMVARALEDAVIYLTTEIPDEEEISEGSSDATKAPNKNLH